MYVFAFPCISSELVDFDNILIFPGLGKFRKLLPILTSKHVSPLTPGKVFSACIRSALLHGSETGAPTAPDLQRLRRNYNAMIHWICCVKPHDEVPMETLYTKLGIQEVAVALRTKRLRWCGHVECASSLTKSITQCPGSIGYLRDLVILNRVLAKTIAYFHIFYAMFFFL